MGTSSTSPYEVLSPSADYYKVTMQGFKALLVSVLVVSAITTSSSCPPSEYTTTPPGLEWQSFSGHLTDAPAGAVQGGYERGYPLYVCRAYHGNAMNVGKAGQTIGSGCAVPWGGEQTISSYEVLVNVADIVNLTWVGAKDGNVPSNAVIGGYTCRGSCEPDRELYYVGRTYNNPCRKSHRECLGATTYFPGKISKCLGNMHWSYGGDEYHTAFEAYHNDYEALTWSYKYTCAVSSNDQAWCHA